jgi:hypothetical protein
MLVIEVLAKKGMLIKKIFTLGSVSINISMKVSKNRKGTLIKNIKCKC